MAAHRTTRSRRRGPGAATPLGTAVELSAGAVLLGLAGLAGLVFVHRPWPNRLDVWGYQLFPADAGSRWAHDFATAGSLTVLLAGVAAVFLIGILRDWVRAAACAVSPVLAVLVVQDLAKPLVGRHLGLTGGSSYPSGTVAAVAALATAVTVVAPRLVRPLAAVVGAVAVAGTCLAVVVLRWHYPTDALGGVAVGIGAVLAVDALFHLPWAVAALVRPVRHRARYDHRGSPVAA
ncbi:MAG: phosphatase PAP2 family protein [Acidimicrobiales bacterium]|jgi:membrane-associated phospholipid phosphatase